MCIRDSHDALEDVKATRYCFEQIEAYKNGKIEKSYFNNWKLLFEPCLLYTSLFPFVAPICYFRMLYYNKKVIIKSTVYYLFVIFF